MTKEERWLEEFVRSGEEHKNRPIALHWYLKGHQDGAKEGREEIDRLKSA